MAHSPEGYLRRERALSAALRRPLLPSHSSSKPPERYTDGDWCEAARADRAGRGAPEAGAPFGPARSLSSSLGR